MRVHFISNPPSSNIVTPTKSNRIQSIDLLRGIVMIIMALDHVRVYFHYDAFLYSPTDLSQTNGFLFFTRFITHYCAPIFVFLAGISAYLYGNKKSRKELSYYLFTRGLWLIIVELVIISLGQSFNPSYPFFNLQVIWAIGVSMIALSVMIYLNRRVILLVSILLIAAHNLLDTVHVPGSFSWAVLHEARDFVFGRFTVFVRYPIIPWIGIISLGYYFGSLYGCRHNSVTRRRILLSLGISGIGLFFILRVFNTYGDPASWAIQKNVVFSLLSLLNLTKYPPSLLYVLVTLGPAMIFLAITERPLNKFTEVIAIFGRVPFFYYIIHIYMIHSLAVLGASISGYNWSAMILRDRVNRVPALKGYGFDLPTVYLVWFGLILFLYPCCRWFDSYKRAHQSTQWWLRYL